MAKSSQSDELKNPGYEIFILLISVLSIANALVIFSSSADHDTQDVLKLINLGLTFILFGDFVLRILTARSKSEYFFRNFGWADLLSSVPLVGMSFFRAFRIVRVYRLMRAQHTRFIINSLVNNRAGTALYFIAFLVIFVLELGGVAILFTESSSPEANITNASDALWWGLVTISTVGYGDQFPVTNSGRLVGFFLIVTGVGLFGVLMGFLTNFFFGGGEEELAEHLISSEMGTAGEKMQVIYQLLEQQEQTNAALKARLAEVEQLLNSGR
ncbi:MAG: ion transporter [Anaerolineales bacterium]|nr:ion transporter [Anaerolineales bacterium]